VALDFSFSFARLDGSHLKVPLQPAAHRQNWFPSNSLTLSPHERNSLITNIKNYDGHVDSRWKDDYSANRVSVALYDLIDAENIRARNIARAMDTGQTELAAELSRKDAPMKVTNEVLRLSNLPIEISVSDTQELHAKKNGGSSYGISELSDGERNALLIAAKVLTAPGNSLFLIDEPERHLHRSIISPLLSMLFQKRSDCAFVVSTHEVMLPLDNPTARTLLVRACRFQGRGNPVAWDADLLPAGGGLDEETKRDILGARRKIIFVEGAETSLDKRL
jgi:hypothetical protein